MQIETDRLRLLPFEARDTDALHRLWTLPEVRRFLWDDRIVAREEVEAQIAASMQSFDENGFGFWAIRTKEPAALAGFCGLRHFGDPPRVEILYGLDPAFTGLGLATEAARAVLRFGFEHAGLERIYASADAPNTASVRVMQRLDMNVADDSFEEAEKMITWAVSRAAFSFGDAYYEVRRRDG
jgi:ribosomal-protein-alanine N-acetyltransferase